MSPRSGRGRRVFDSPQTDQNLGYSQQSKILSYRNQECILFIAQYKIVFYNVTAKLQISNTTQHVCYRLLA